MEMETQVMIAGRMGYVSKESEDRALAQAADVGRMLAGLVRALTRRRRSRNRREIGYFTFRRVSCFQVRSVFSIRSILTFTDQEAVTLVHAVN